VTHSAQNGKIIDQSQPFKHPLKLGFNLVDIFLSKKKKNLVDILHFSVNIFLTE
jgi:hypothetical protein